MADISKIKIGDDEYSIKDEKRHEHENKDILDLIGLGKHGNLTVKTETESESILWNVHNGSVIESYEIDEETGDITLFVRLVPNLAIPAEKIKIKQSFDNGSADLSEIAETVTVNEQVTLFDSDTDELVNKIVLATGVYSDNANFLATPMIDATGEGKITVRIDGFTAGDGSTERILWIAQYDADKNYIADSRKYFNMYWYNENGNNIVGAATANLAIQGTNVGYIYSETDVELADNAKYIVLFNMRPGDTVDMSVIRTIDGEIWQIKQDALPDEVKNSFEIAEEAKATAMDANNTSNSAKERIDAIATAWELDGCSDYVYSLALKVATAAKSHITENSLCLVTYTDTHYQEGDTMLASRVAKLLADLTNAKAIIHLGDLTHGVNDNKATALDLWQKHNAIVSNGKIPYLQVVGNHDDNNHFNRNKFAEGDETARNEANYISSLEMFTATTQNARKDIVLGSKKGWYYLDDEDSKSRIIVLNSHDYPWATDENGDLLYDSYANTTDDPLAGIFSIYSPEQVDWFANVALDFSNKENESEWQALVFAHLGTSNWYYINYLLRMFKSGTKVETLNAGAGDKYGLYDCNGTVVTSDFSVSPRKTMLLLGDRHEDYFATYGTTEEEMYPCVLFLNASLAKDQPNAPTKTKGTPTETAVSVLVFNPDEGKMHEIRFGAGTNEAGTYDPLTDYDNYRVVEY